MGWENHLENAFLSSRRRRNHTRNSEKWQIGQKHSYENDCPSPDRSGNPFIFFL